MTALNEAPSADSAQPLAIGERFVVVDDVLPEAVFAEWAAAERRATFRPSFSSVNPMFDGMSFFSETAFSAVEVSAESVAAVRSAVDAATARLDESSPACRDEFRFWRYGRGVGLDWHDDGASRAAAFILYLSATWRADWGGELEIVDCSVDDVPCQYSDVGRDLMNAPVLRTAIAPKPNRLVVMLGRTFHRVRKVEAGAGDTIRRSLSGFVVAESSARDPGVAER